MHVFLLNILKMLNHEYSQSALRQYATLYEGPLNQRERIFISLSKISHIYHQDTEKCKYYSHTKLKVWICGFKSQLWDSYSGLLSRLKTV